MTRNNHSGKVLDGRYEILYLLDEGGMGAVYLGRHIKLGRRVAVKILRGELAGNKELVARFYREAQSASVISHPNIIDVYDVGVADWGEPYLVMEYLSGENLASVLDRKGPISLAAACGIMEPALRALQAAHDRGIVHRDLKPENIFLMGQEDAPPVVKVIDFGISKFLQAEQTKLTRTGSLLGTPSYMSPEQARGRGTFDHRSDIYSMGVVLHYMLCGCLPFVGESYNDLIVNILTEPVPPPSETYAAFPAEVEPIVMRLLQKDPEQRFSTCMEVLDALTALAAFAGRQEALGALTADMPKACFATGDLGEADAVFEAAAATVYAEMGQDGVETVRVSGTPSADEDSQEAPSAAAPKSSASSRSQGRSRRWGVLLGAVILAAVGFGVVGLGWVSPVASPPSAPVDSEPVAPTAAPQTPATTSTNTPIKTPTKNPTTPRAKDGVSTAAPALQDGTNGDTASIPTSKVVGDLLQGSNAQGEPVTGQTPAVEVSPAAATAGSSGDNHSAAPGAKSISADGSGIPSGKLSPTQPKGTLEKTSVEAPAKFPTSTTENAAVVEAPVEGELSPLTPVAINRLLEARHGKVMTCYDIARAKMPDLAGVLELKVGMAGSTVNVTVTGGNVTGYLSNCIIRIIKSISVPPNDGTLVEILKEYEFR